MSRLEKIQPKYPMLAQVSVCQGCCCGHTEKGNAEVPMDWLKKEWKYRGLNKRVHLTSTGCLGPCDVPNVVAISSFEGTQWLARLDSQRHYQALVDWAEQTKLAGRLLPLPREFRSHALEAYREQPPLSFEGD